MNTTLRNYLIETIKVHASEANMYIVDEQADLLTLKSYEDNPKHDRVIFHNLTINEVLEMAENDGFRKEKYKNFHDLNGEFLN